MKLKDIKVRVLTSPSAAGLETLLTDFLRTGAEATLVQVEYSIVAGVYSCLILYAN